MRLRTKRVYEPAEKRDGRRILVDRLWPRGLSRDKAQIDFWARDCAPSTALRRWYAHDHDKWPEFRRRYFAELDEQKDAVNELRSQLGRGTTTLLFSSKEPRFNNAEALRSYLERTSKTRRARSKRRTRL